MDTPTTLMRNLAMMRVLRGRLHTLLSPTDRWDMEDHPATDSINLGQLHLPQGWIKGHLHRLRLLSH